MEIRDDRSNYCRLRRAIERAVRGGQGLGMRRAAKADANQAEIVDRLRRCGISVEIIGMPLDLLIHSPRTGTALMEVKGEDGRLTKQQIEFISRWPGPIHVVRNAEEAVKAAIGEK